MMATGRPEWLLRGQKAQGHLRKVEIFSAKLKEDQCAS